MTLAVVVVVPAVVVVITVLVVVLEAVEVLLWEVVLVVVLEELEVGRLTRVSSSATVPFKPSTNSNFTTVELKKVTLLKP